tara:strand:+ start:203 stop:676 length:474 start_codon:yes stop_codon:yes gene_type:complete
MGFDIMQTELGQKLNRFGYALYNQVIWVSVLKRPSLRTFILDLVREDQLLEQGIDEDGDVIGTYSEYTEIINPEKVAGSHYTLKDTGEFFDSFYIDVFPSYFEINANPIKTDDDGETTNLFYEYGEGIMGLTTESLDKLSREILRLYAIEVRRFLQV